jgi:hypothetical protein
MFLDIFRENVSLRFLFFMQARSTSQKLTELTLVTVLHSVPADRQIPLMFKDPHIKKYVKHFVEPSRTFRHTISEASKRNEFFRDHFGSLY